MLFGKKKENLSDQQAMFQKRKVPRYALTADASIEGFEGEGVLENICVSGCCLQSATYVSLIPDEVYKVTILPGPGETIKPFTSQLKVSWTKSSEMLFQAGFSLDSGQSSHQLEQYVDILKSRGVQPDYGNMK